MLRANVVGPPPRALSDPYLRARSASSSRNLTRIGRYEVIERIGVGGMAEVWKAKSIDPDGKIRIVAVKQLAPELDRDPQLVTMFLDEAALAAQLSHPGIVAMEETGRDDQGRAYMVLEYVDGHDLRWCLATAAKAHYWLPVEFSLTVVRDLARALAFAHDARGTDGQPLHLVHRDVSHSNVFLSKAGRVKLADFGIARARGRASETRTGMVKGKLGYLSPEQVRAEPLDGRSDVFSACVVLWELLTQRRMFIGETDFKTMLAVCRDRRRPVSELRPGLPPALDALVSKGVEIDRDLRFESAEALEDAIDDLAKELDLKLGPTITSGVVQYLTDVAVTLEHESSHPPEQMPATVELDDPFTGPITAFPENDGLDPSDVFAQSTSDIQDIEGLGIQEGAERTSYPDTPIAPSPGTARRGLIALDPIGPFDLVHDGVTGRLSTFEALMGALLDGARNVDDEIWIDGRFALPARELATLLELDPARALCEPMEPEAWIPASGLDPVASLADLTLQSWTGYLLARRDPDVRGLFFASGTISRAASLRPSDQLAVALAAATEGAPLDRLITEVVHRRRPLTEVCAVALGLAPDMMMALRTGLEVEITAEILRLGPQALARRSVPVGPRPSINRSRLHGITAAAALAWPADVAKIVLAPFGARRVGVSSNASVIAEALGLGRGAAPVLTAIHSGISLQEIRRAAPETPVSDRIFLLLIGSGAIRLR